MSKSPELEYTETDSLLRDLLSKGYIVTYKVLTEKNRVIKCLEKDGEMWHDITHREKLKEKIADAKSDIDKIRRQENANKIK